MCVHKAVKKSDQKQLAACKTLATYLELALELSACPETPFYEARLKLD